VGGQKCPDVPSLGVRAGKVKLQCVSRLLNAWAKRSWARRSYRRRRVSGSAAGQAVSLSDRSRLRVTKDPVHYQLLEFL
jgi:hypothetical protein